MWPGFNCHHLVSAEPTSGGLGCSSEGVVGVT
jgi:hypothetical protein